MSSNPLRLDFLFKKYINNTCTPQELEEFWHLMSELSDNDLLSLGLYDLWHDENTVEAETPRNWEEGYQKLQNKIEVSNGPRSTSNKTIRLLKYISIAAALTGIMFGVWILLSKGNKNHEEKLDTQSLAGTKKGTKHPLHTVSLPDGTVVLLHNNSSLSNIHYTANSREVYLDGEAYFDVKHNPSKPFVVHSARYNTIVLGTAFNVNTKEDGENFTLTVTRGKVRIEDAVTHKVMGVLTRKEQLKLPENETTQSLPKKANVELVNVIDWTTRLTFDNITWNDAAVILGNKYGIDIRFKNEKIRGCQFTGDFNDKPLAECMDVLCALTNTKWEKTNNGSTSIVWVEGEGCPMQ